MREQILEDLKSAMKSQEKEKLAVIRMVKGAIQMEELNLKRTLTDDEVIGVIAKQIKTRRESIEEFKKASRMDLVNQNENEIKILQAYMPQQLSEEEVIEEISKAFEEVNPSGMSDMGKVMNVLNSKLKGKADMSFVSKIVKDKINGLN